MNQCYGNTLICNTVEIPKLFLILHDHDFLLHASIIHKFNKFNNLMTPFTAKRKRDFV